MGRVPVLVRKYIFTGTRITRTRTLKEYGTNASVGVEFTFCPPEKKKF